MSIASPVNFRPLIQTFGNRNFAIFTSGNTVSLVGTWMQRMAAGWLAWELTGSAAWLGVIAFADLFPTVVLGPIAGAVADRWDRLQIIRIGEFLSLIQAVVLFGLSAGGIITIEMLFGLNLFLGAASALNQPARLATIPVLVRADDVPAAVAINSMIFNVARFIGPALGGAVILTLGVSAAFAMNAVSFAVFLIALSQVHPRQEESRPADKRSLWSELAEGIRYTAGHRGISPIFLLMIITGLCSRPVVELLPGFAGRVFDLGADGLALFTSAVGAGAMLAGFWLSGRDSETSGIINVILRTTALLAVTLIVFSVSPWAWLAVPALVVAGFCLSVAGITLQTLIYFAVHPSMRGRVLSLYGTVFRGGPAIGALLMGLLSEGVGMRWPPIAGSMIVLCFWAGLRRSRTSILAHLGGGANGAGALPR